MPPWERYSQAPAAGPWARYGAAAGPQEPDSLTDAVKSAGTGVAEGAIGIAGGGGDLRNLLSRGTDWAGEKLGLSPETVGSIKSGASAAARFNPLTAAIAHGPTSAEVERVVKERTGEFYQPQTTAGEYTRTVGQFVPAAAAGPGGVIRRMGMQAVLPAVASEAAGQYTKGTEAEPYARTGAALAAGVIGARRAPTERVSADQLRDAARAGYRDPVVTDLVLDPAAMQRVGGAMARRMEAGGARRDYAGAAFNRADEMADLPNTQAARNMQAAGLNPGATVGDIQSVRTALGNVVRDGTDPLTGGLNTTANAAQTGRRTINEYLTNIPARDVIRGDAAAAGATLRRADADYAASQRARMVEALIRRAEAQTGSANSGQNINNATRQKLRTLLTNEKKNAGLSDAEMEQLSRAVLGTRIGNAARTIGNKLDASGILSTVPGATIGGGAYLLGADPSAAVAIAGASKIIGRGARNLGNASQARQANRFQDMVVQRAPSYEALRAGNAAAASRLTAEERRLAVVRALLSAQNAPRLNAQPQPVNQ